MVRKRYDLVCIGTALVDSIIRGFDPNPVSASGYCAESGSLNVGGEAVNAAIAAGKLGAKTGIRCSVGKDAAGDIILAALKDNGVDTALVLRKEGNATPVTTMFVNKDGSRKSITNGAHRYNFHPEKDLSVLKNTRGIILGSLFRAPFDDPEIVYSVLSAAAAENTVILADTKLPNFQKLQLRDLKESLSYIDYITPNEDEARFYSGRETPEEMADVFLEWGIKNVIIKLGEKGCYMKNAEISVSLSAFDIKAADATGAGDNFVAGFATEILRGATASEALCFANACGAICTTAVGAGTALQSREQVLRFIDKTQKRIRQTEK